MVRGIIGVVVGFIAWFLLFGVCFAIAWVILGEQGSFQADTWNLTPTWVVMSAIVGLVTAMAAGLICRIVARNRTAVIVLATVALVYSIFGSVMSSARAEELRGEVRPADVSMTDAMNKAIWPGYILIVNPIIGAVGVLAGGMMRTGAQPPAPQDPPPSDAG